MPLIDDTYFIGELHVAQLSQPAVLEKLNDFIVKYQADLLMRLLGSGLAFRFKEGLEADPVEAKWLALRDGFLYTVNGEERYWRGLQNEEKQSIIANYVYYHYTINEVYHTTGIGNIKPSAENGQIVSPASKLEKAWNEMRIGIGELLHFLKFSDLFPEWKGIANPKYFDRVNSYNL